MVDEPTSVEPRRDELTPLHPSWMVRRSGSHAPRRPGPPAPSRAEIPYAVDRRVNVRPVSRTKVTPAPVGEAVLARDRLLDWLHRQVHRRIVTVVAETGYGKTTLLADFTRRTAVRCLWYRLDGSDRDWITFVHYVVAAVREALPAFGSATLALFRDDPPDPSPDLVVSTLLAELAEIADQTTVLVLDDWQVVDDEPAIRSVMTRLVAGAPDRMSFVVLSRRPPRLSLGRLAAQGEASELTRDDLRFSPDETERLLRDSLHAPLEPEVVAQIEAKTEGWAASLQMLRSSLRGRSPADVRAFVRALSGAEGRLYDYLAEEVMADLPPDVQRFLTLTSILDTVSPHLAAAIYGAEPEPPSAEIIEAWCRSASESGLMARRSALATGRRYHPLLRQFLQHRLLQMVSASELRGMHLRVGRAAESNDWLVACHHYAKAEARVDATRVLSANAADALGTGVWRDAAELSRAVGASDEDPRIAVIQARDEVYGGRFNEALRRVERFDLGALDGATRGLVVQARIHASWWAEDVERTSELVRLALEDPAVPTDWQSIAVAMAALLATAHDGPLHDATTSLAKLAQDQAAAGKHYFAGISRLNLSVVHVCQGERGAAVDEAAQAVELLRICDRQPDELYSAHLPLARALFEAGRFDEGREQLLLSLQPGGVGESERCLEAAALLVPIGEVQRARDLISRANLLDGGRARQNALVRVLAEGAALLAEGDATGADSVLGVGPAAWPALGTCSWLAWIHLKLLVELSMGRLEAAGSWLRQGLDLASKQGSTLYRDRLRLLAAMAKDDARASADALEQASDVDILSSADVLVAWLHKLGPLPRAVRSSVERWPRRWLPLVRSALSHPDRPNAVACARLLDEYGELSDVPLLRALARGSIKGLRGTDIGRALARRRSPRLEIEDLGRSELHVGERRVEVSSMRRKAASVLCFLLTRTSMLAAKE